ncbi:hypothetical protein ACFFX0_32815 [Citricoccus parietis]|uniref:Uncharacterized protein n=1 Tax=Citricoccus parietis TaxID=592307 RepID=A0ABV5G9S9_9MICC
MASQPSSSLAIFAVVKFLTLNPMSPTSASTKPDFRIVSLEKLNPFPV